MFISEENLEDVAETFLLMGKIFGKDERANEFVQYFTNQVEEIKNISSKIPEQKTVLIIQPIMDRLYLVNSNDILAEVVRLVGAEYVVNVTVQGRMPIRVQVNKEKIVNTYKDVDIVILISSPITPPEHVEALKDEMLNDEVWKGIKAVREGRVVFIRSDLGKGSYFRWGPRIAVGMWQVAHVIYPEYYPDWRNKEEDFLQQFYRLS